MAKLIILLLVNFFFNIQLREKLRAVAISGMG